MQSQRFNGSLAIVVGLLTLMGMLILLGMAGQAHLAYASPGTLYVAPIGNDRPTCTSSQPCRTLQHAVDVAATGDTIKVAAGQYTGVSQRFNPYEGETVTQVVYISKTVIIRGGYTTAFVEPPDPVANATIFNAQKQGRVFHIFGNVAPTLEGLRLTGGIAVTGTHYGGGVYVLQAQAHLSKCQIYDNAADYGGGIWLDISASTLSDNTIYSNTASDGGGVYFNHSDGAKLVENTIFTNTAGHFGGGVYVSYSAAQLSANTIISNSAVESGGGLFAHESAAQISGNKIAANYAGYSSGGLQLSQGSAQVSGNLIVSNTAAYDGGGVYLYHSKGDILNGNSIAGNTVSRDGGGGYVSGGAATFNANIIQANTAAYGGGLQLQQSSTSFNGNKVLANTAGWSGGALYLGDGNVVTMTNTVIADNHATNGQGSGMYLAGSTVTLLHTTLARNSGGSGRGIYATDYGMPQVYSTVTLTNTIIVNQTVGVFVDSGSTAKLESTLWNNNGANTGGAGTIDIGTHNYTGDPLFASDGYHLTTGSAAIEKGISAGVMTDIDGELRPSLSPDLGADEYWAPGALHKVYLPVALKTP